MENLTALETAALRNMITSGFEGPTYWQDAATGGPITGASVGGVVSSLAKKGFVYCSGRGRDATIDMTAETYAFAQTLA